MKRADLLPSAARRQTERMAVIERETAATFGLSQENLYHWGRESRYVWPRQVTMWLMRRLTGATLQEIGSRFKKDHGTVLCAERRVQAIMDSYPQLKRELLALEKKIEGINNENRTAGETSVAERSADLPEITIARVSDGDGRERVL